MISPGRVVQRAVHQHVVGRAGRDRIDGERHGAGHLAVTLETGDVARIDAEVLGEPVRRDDADTVDREVRARRREQRAAREAVDLRDLESRVRDGASCRVECDGAQRPRCVPLHRALPVADDRDLVARGEAAAHRSASTNAGIECPDARSSKATVTSRADPQRGVRPVEQAPDHPQLVLLVELDVDEHERDVVVEPGEERLSKDRPAADHASATHGLEHVRRIAAATVPADEIDRDRERSAPRAARHREHVRRRGLPVRRGLVVGYRDRPRQLAHGMTPASLSAPICSHV